ncbi:VOC family protein, partial [Vibrio parahaemolyticus]
MTKMIHTLIRVRDLDRSLQFYRDALELEIKDPYVFDGFSLTYLAN